MQNESLFNQNSAGIFKQSMGTMNRVGIGLSGHRTVPARQAHRLVEFIPWNQFRGPINV
jgi:hypothetical protein